MTSSPRTIWRLCTYLQRQTSGYVCQTGKAGFSDCQGGADRDMRWYLVERVLQGAGPWGIGVSALWGTGCDLQQTPLPVPIPTVIVI